MRYKITENLKNTGAAALEVEKIHGLKPNNSKKSDFEDSELKSKTNLTKNSVIKLFNRTFSNVEEIVTKYGKKHDVYDIMVLYTSLKSNKNSNVYKKNNLSISVNRTDEKIYLVANDKIEKRYYIEFKEIKEACNEKIKNLIIKGITLDNDELYFDDFYKHYKNVSYEKVIDAIEKGYISVGVECGVHNSPSKIGQRHNHGCPFKIKNSDFLKIYESFIEIKNQL